MEKIVIEKKKTEKPPTVSCMEHNELLSGKKIDIEKVEEEEEEESSCSV